MADKRFYYAILAGSDDGIRRRSLLSFTYPYKVKETQNYENSIYDFEILEIGKLYDEQPEISSLSFSIYDAAVRSPLVEYFETENVNYDFSIFDCNVLDVVVDYIENAETANHDISIYSIEIPQLEVKLTVNEDIANHTISIYSVDII